MSLGGVESFILVSKSAHKAPFLVLCHSTNMAIVLSGILDMHNCCIRVTAVLEYFKWTSSYTTHLVFRCLFSPMLPMSRWWGHLLVLSNYYGLIIKGCIPHTRSLLLTIKGHGHCDSKYTWSRLKTVGLVNF